MSLLRLYDSISRKIRPMIGIYASAPATLSANPELPVFGVCVGKLDPVAGSAPTPTAAPHFAQNLPSTVLPQFGQKAMYDTLLGRRGICKRGLGRITSNASRYERGSR